MRRIEAPALESEAAADRALADYDRNKDGYLGCAGAGELPRAQGGTQASGQGRRRAFEPGARSWTGFRSFEDSQVGLFVTTVKVQLDGKPLGGASVELEPEPFMGPSIKAARATTDDNGRAMPRTADADLPGCQFGFYRVRISKKDSSGKELVPARYQNTLGAAVPSGGTLVFSLTSK